MGLASTDLVNVGTGDFLENTVELLRLCEAWAVRPVDL